MDQRQEYQDPDYPGTSSKANVQPESISEEEKVIKIRKIIRREFGAELSARESEVMVADQRLSTARRMLHRLRYNLVSRYYGDQKLQLSASQIDDAQELTSSGISGILKDGQRNIHPSVRKLLGKDSVDLNEILRYKGPRQKQRKNYSAMVTRNYTIQADSTKSLRPDPPPEPVTDPARPGDDPGTSRVKKIPRQIDPKVENVVTVDEVTRNKMKHRYRIIIGNTSKYVPPASGADRSTHKWLLYIRGAASGSEGLARLVTRVSVTLHHSYAPHHTVHIDKPPFHISRRGWGEFPAKVELHFALPERNRPATIEHTIKLDRNYTGLQTLGAETIVDVWLYSTQDMLQYEYKEDTDEQTDVHTGIVPKTEPVETPDAVDELQDSAIDKTDSWLDFFSTETTELDVDEMIIKPVKSKENTVDVFTGDGLTGDILTSDKIKQECENEYSDEFTAEEHDLPDVNNHNDVDDTPLDIHPTTPKKKIMKYMDPTTGKIFYLELDRDIDLNSVQEIVINSKGNVKTAKISPVKMTNGHSRPVRKSPQKKGVSLLRPEVKTLLENELKKVKCHIQNDHCYLGSDWAKNINIELNKSSIQENVCMVKKERSLYDSLCENLKRFYSVRAAVNYLLRKVPLMSDEARDPDFLVYFPFAVESEERYWRLDFAKRRNIEWSRAKLINTLLTENLKTSDQIWRTKQILIYSRLHGFYPFRTDSLLQSQTDWNSWQSETNIKNIYPNATDISSLSIFDAKEFLSNTNDSILVEDSEDEVDIVGEMLPAKVKKEVVKMTDEIVLPVENEDDRLRYAFVEKKCADIGIELRNEDVGNGYSYSCVHAVLVSAMRSFAEELLRDALAEQLMEEGSPTTVWKGSSTCPTALCLEAAYRASSRRPALAAQGRGKIKQHVSNI